MANDEYKPSTYKNERVSAAEVQIRNLSLAVAQSASMVVITDTDGCIEYVNPQFTRVTGYAPEEVLGKTPRVLKSGQTPDAVYRALWAAISQGKDWHGELHNQKKNGESFWVSASISPVKDQEGRIVNYLSIEEDITAHKKMVAALQESEERCRALNAELEHRVALRTRDLEALNAELESFAFSVSHDLQAPLRSIAGFCDILTEDYAAALDAEGRDYLNRVNRAAGRMAGLIADMLAFSRQTRGDIEIESIDLSRMAQIVISDLREHEPAREVVCRIESDLVAQGDRKMLRVVLENLFGNAWKFTGRQAEARIDFGRSEVNGSIAFFVKDNGVGFDARYADKMFNPFHRLHQEDEFPGNGIGLATVQRILHRHGGWIRAEGTKGKGATFYFALPGEGNK